MIVDLDLVIIWVITGVILIVISSMLVSYRKTETFTMDHLHDILNCDSLYPDGLLLQDVGKSYESTNNLLYDPYIELSPKLLQRILNSFTDEKNIIVSSYERLQTLFNEWFISYIYQVKDPILVDRKEATTLQFYFSKEPCKFNKSADGSEYELRCLMYRKERSFGYIVTWYIKDQQVVTAKINSIVSEDRISLLYQTTPEIFQGRPSNITRSSLDKNSILFLSSTKEGNDDSNTQGYSCYFQDTHKRKFYCESEFDLFGSRKESGAWDKPCQINTDCPFYQKNLNYPNNRGGCIKGVCEMPVNTPYRGPTYIDNSNVDPYCFNCDKGDHEYKCCKEQMVKKRPSYSLMASPDYAFVNDYLERRKYQEILQMRNLKV